MGLRESVSSRHECDRISSVELFPPPILNYMRYMCKSWGYPQYLMECQARCTQHRDYELIWHGWFPTGQGSPAGGPMKMWRRKEEIFATLIPQSCLIGRCNCSPSFCPLATRKLCHACRPLCGARRENGRDQAHMGRGAYGLRPRCCQLVTR
jgi:hypothetical protein